jgi:hypothetical protein
MESERIYIYIYIRKWKQFQKDEPDSLAPRENKEWKKRRKNSSRDQSRKEKIQLG